MPGDERAGRRRRGRGARSRPEAAGRPPTSRADLGPAKREGEDEINERKVTVLLADFATVWGELFPVEQARVVQLLRSDVQEDTLEVRVRAEGLASLVGELRQQGERMAA